MRLLDSSDKHKAYLAFRSTLQGAEDMDPEALARAVFAVLEEKISDAEIDEVKHALPAEIRELWPRHAQ